MDKGNFSYRIKAIIAGVLLWEILFWVLFVSFLWLMGYFSNGNSGTQLGFKFGEHLVYLYLLVPVCGVFFWYLNWKNKRFQLLGERSTLQYIVKPLDSFRTFISFFLFRNALVFTVLSLAQPVFGSKKVSGTIESMELVLAIDVSNSMNTKDIDGENSRLQIVKRAMIQLVNKLHGEKIGISIFAGGSYLQLPLTIDYEAAKMYINEIETDMVSNQGTNIAAALDISQRMFSKEKTSKAILIVTDGEDHEGGIDEALAPLKEAKIMIAVLGIGTEKGGSVPNDPERPELGFKTDAMGRTVISKMNPGLIHDIARKAGGFSSICSNPYPDLTALIDRFSQLKRSKVDSIELDVKENWFQVPLFFAMVFWLGFVFLAAFDKSKRI